MSTITTIFSISLIGLISQAEAEPGYGHATSYIYRGVEGLHGHYGYGGYGYGKRSAEPGYYGHASSYDYRIQGLHGHYGYGKRSAEPGYGGYYGQAYVYEDRLHGAHGHYGGYGYGKRAAADEDVYDRYYDGGHYTGHYHVVGTHVHHGHSELIHGHHGHHGHHSHHGHGHHGY